MLEHKARLSPGCSYKQIELSVKSVVLFLLFLSHPAQLFGGFLHRRGVQVDPLAPIPVEAEERLLRVAGPLRFHFLDGLGEFFRRVLDLGVRFVDFLQKLAEILGIEIDDGHVYLAVDELSPPLTFRFFR